MAYVSRGPPIIPDSRISQVRFETLAFPPWAYPSSARLKRWFAYTPSSVVCPQSRSTTCVGLTPALSPTAALTMEPPSVQSPFAQFRRYRYWGVLHRLLRGHYSSVIAHTDSCANPIWLSPPSVFHLVAGVSAGCYQTPAANGIFPTLSLRVFPEMPGPLPRRSAGCSYLLLPLRHRPSPKEL